MTGSVDATTGLSIDIDGFGRLTSDKVFSTESDVYKKFFKRNTITSFQGEVEFGSDYIVLTTLTKEPGNSADRGDGWTERWVVQGQFKYAGDKIISAVIESTAQVSSSYGALNYYPGGVRVGRPSNADSWASALSQGGSSYTGFNNIDGVIQGDIASFYAFGGGRFFSPGWESNPFASKLSSTGGSGSTSTSSTSSSTNSLTLNKNYDVSSITNAILGSSTPSNALSVEVSDKTLTINASSWTGSIKINFAAKAAAQGERLDAKQIDFSSAIPAGSILQGGDGNDQLWGKAGWDVFDGGKGNDLIRAGNGRDILTGGSGADELHGDFGWNTYKSEKDGFSDLIAIKSDQHLSNWLYGKAGNNPNGEKADIIEGLDANDKIRIIGVFSPDITVRAGATAHGVSGIGIYAKGALEALYTGGDLSVAQLTAMTSGDGSAAAMANQVSSYGWTGV